VNSVKNNIKIYIKIDIKTTPTCFGAVTPSSASSLFELAKVLLLTKRYNLYKVLACSTAFFQLSVFCATFFQLLMFMLFISSKTSSSQRVFALPIGLLDMGFHLLIFWLAKVTVVKIAN
jgi:hypothetical protein